MYMGLPKLYVQWGYSAPYTGMGNRDMKLRTIDSDFSVVQKESAAFFLVVKRGRGESPQIWWENREMVDVAASHV